MDRAPLVTAPPSQATTTPDRPPRVWPAILTLYFLAPIVGEVLSLNTPPLTLLLNPATLIFEPGLYGSGALLIREIARRRGLGWPGVLMLGAAYGVLEEGVFIQTWFIPSGVDTYGRAFGVNWVWAAGLTIFHAVFSIAIPILLTGAIFPRVADRPWLGHVGRWLFSVWFGAIVVFGFVAYGFFLYRKVGYTHPPLTLAVAIVSALAFSFAGLRMRSVKHMMAPAQSTTPLPITAAPALASAMPPQTPPYRASYQVAPYLQMPTTPQSVRPPRRSPGLWSLRVFGFVATVAYLVAFYGLGALHIPGPIVILAMAGVAALVAWRVVRWSARAGWGAAQRLALGSGALAAWLVITPVGWATGLPVVGLAFVALLVWLAWRTPQSAPVAEIGQ